MMNFPALHKKSAYIFVIQFRCVIFKVKYKCSSNNKLGKSVSDKITIEWPV